MGAVAGTAVSHVGHRHTPLTISDQLLRLDGSFYVNFGDHSFCFIHCDIGSGIPRSGEGDLAEVDLIFCFHNFCLFFACYFCFSVSYIQLEYVEYTFLLY